MKEIGSDFTLQVKNVQDLFFVSGRVGIKYILSHLTQRGDKCLIPNYLCESIQSCFTEYDYYDIHNDLSISIDSIKSHVSKNNYKIIFIINYFGRVDKQISLLQEVCTSNNILIIEDFTHNMFSSNLYGDVCLCSYRKSLETPFGCIVIDKTKLLPKQNTSFNLKYLISNVTKITGMILKNVSCLKSIWYPILQCCEKYIESVTYNGFDYINYTFYKYYYDPSNKYIRGSNFIFLHDTLMHKPMIKNEKNDTCYFTYPILFSSRDERELVRSECIKQQIYCPVYWPLDFDVEKKCNHYIADSILCIPIDQRYNIDSMKRIQNVCNIICTND